MERKIGSAILKGSMLLAAMFLMEGSVYPVQAEEYSTFGTFSPDHFPAAAKEGETIEEESEVLSLGEKISRFGTGNGLSGSPGKIPSRADEKETQGTEFQDQADSTAFVPQTYKVADISDPLIRKTVARAYVPSDYTVDGENIWCGKWQSLGAPAQVYLTAMSPDQNTVLGYYSLVCYEEILEYSQNGTSLSEQQDGVFDSTTMTPMLRFMMADTYCDYLAKAILPGQQLEFCKQEEITEEAQKQMDEKAEELYQQSSQLFQGTGYNVDGTYAGVAQREYNVSLNAYPFKLVITTAVEGTQMSFTDEFAYNMGTMNSSFIAWDSPSVFFHADSGKRI